MREHTYFETPGSFMTVRHLTMHGTNFAIGQQLGELARERYGTVPERFRGDPRFARARRAFLERTYPIQWERTRGVAAALGPWLAEGGGLRRARRGRLRHHSEGTSVAPR